MNSSLTEAIKAFSNWRESGNRCGRINRQLKGLALSALQDHDEETVINRLKISRASLNKWKLEGIKPAKQLGSDFVKIPFCEAQKPWKKEAFVLNWGMVWSLSFPQMNWMLMRA